MHNEEDYNFNPSPNEIKNSEMIGNVARMSELRNAYKVLFEEPERKCVCVCVCVCVCMYACTYVRTYVHFESRLGHDFLAHFSCQMLGQYIETSYGHLTPEPFRVTTQFRASS